MDEMISYCGLNCQNCQIYLATREKDEDKQLEMRVEIVQKIKELYGQEYKPEDVSDCDGCKIQDGRLFAGSHNCHMRNCASKKLIENCAYCEDYPCQELENLFTLDKDARIRLDAIRSTL